VNSKFDQGVDKSVTSKLYKNGEISGWFEWGQGQGKIEIGKGRHYNPNWAPNDYVSELVAVKNSDIYQPICLS
jgi:hypothetical protein